MEGCRICTILPWWAMEFCKLSHWIWQNLPWKTVGRSYLQCSFCFFKSTI